MSGKISGMVWDADLPRNLKYVLLAYADHADHEGGGSSHPLTLWPGKLATSEGTLSVSSKSWSMRNIWNKQE